MKSIKLIVIPFILFFGIVMACTSVAEPTRSDNLEAVWLDNFEEAKLQASESKVPILVNFSGSDWCGWCQRLANEVFTKETFIKFANDSLILFEADFPRYKSLSDTIAKQNQALATQFGIRGFPTILLLDGEGNEIGRTGYQPGGAEVYVNHLKGFLNKAEITSTENRSKVKKTL